MPKITNNYDLIFQKFRLGLQNWCRTGKEPSAGDQDMKYYLDLQEKRLKDHELKMDISMEPDKEIMAVSQIAENIPAVGKGFAKFSKSLYAQYMNRSVTFSRDGEEVLKKTDYPVMYQTIISPDPEDKGIGKTTYVCPNCGAVSTIEELQDTGCPFCGTRYLMKDLYPKVSNFYFVENGSKSEGTWKKEKNRILLFGALASIFQTVYTLFTDADFSLLQALPTLISGFGLWSFAIYFVYAIWHMIKLLKGGAKAGVLIGSTARAKDKINDTLKKYDVNFDYEYFEGKALSLARILMLSKEPEEFVQYEGKSLSGRFSDVVDIQYRGRIGVRKIQNKNNRIEVELDLYLTNTLDQGGRLKEKEEVVQLSMYHNADFPVDRSFSILKVQCPNCGGSFDAEKGKNCPYCGSKYDAGIDDWIVTEIRRKD